MDSASLPSGSRLATPHTRVFQIVAGPTLGVLYFTRPMPIRRPRG